MSNHRYSKFWWQDWQNDPALRICSLAARGLWMEILAICHSGTPTGHCTVNGKAAKNKQIAALARCTEREVIKLVAELEEAGVFSRTDAGVMYSRRMVRDTERSEEGAKAVAKRWNGSGGNAPPTSDPNRSASKGAGTQYSEAEIIDHRSEADARVRARRRPFNPFLEIIAEEAQAIDEPEHPAPIGIRHVN